MFTIKVYEDGGYTAYSTPNYSLRCWPDRACVRAVLFDLNTGINHELDFSVPEGSEKSIAIYVENSSGKTIDRQEIYWNQVIKK